MTHLPPPNIRVTEDMFKLFTEPKDKPKRNYSPEEITNRLEKR
jgi:hypothetical protein